MKRVEAVLLALVLPAALGLPAMAADPDFPEETTDVQGFYVRGDAGWSFLDWNRDFDDDSFTAGGGVGYQLSEYLRTDLRVDWAGGFDLTDDAELDLITALGNVYFELPTSTLVTPFVGAGVGWGWANAEGPVGDDNGVAYALTAGASFDITDQIMVDSAYRLRGVDTNNDDALAHEFTSGLRFKF